MISEWRHVAWGDISQLEYGKALKGYKERTTGVPVYGTNGPIGYTDEPLASGPAVIVGRKGAYRGVHLAKTDFWVIDTAFYLEVDKERVDMIWAYYALLDTDINSRDSGSAIPSLSRRDFDAIRLKLPPLTEQRAIAEVLGALDDRIDWCRDTASRLEGILLAFCLGATEREAAVSSLAEYVNGGAFTKHANGEGRLVIRISELNSGASNNSKYADIEVPEEQTAYPGDILFSWSATLDVFRWTGDEAIVNQHIFKVMPNGDFPAWLVYAKLRESMPAFQKIARDRATTMGHIKRGHLKQVQVQLPAPERLAEMQDLGDALWEQHLRVHREARLLAAMRDALLPKLLSGELRIEDPSGLLESVA